jgi:hypothetical protein
MHVLHLIPGIPAMLMEGSGMRYVIPLQQVRQEKLSDY